MYRSVLVYIVKCNPLRRKRTGSVLWRRKARFFNLLTVVFVSVETSPAMADEEDAVLEALDNFGGDAAADGETEAAGEAAGGAAGGAAGAVAAEAAGVEVAASGTTREARGPTAPSPRRTTTMPGMAETVTIRAAGATRQTAGRGLTRRPAECRVVP